jgi:uncharacterized protein YjbI with pentapeptide repeats
MDRSWVRVPLVVAAALAGATVFAAAIWTVPSMVVDHDLAGAAMESKDRVSAINNVRTTLLQALGGMAVFAAAYVTWRQVRVGQDGVRATREGQITDRFGRAVEHTGSEQLNVRIGGLYSLWRVAEHSAQDRTTVISIMAAFLRIHLPWNRTSSASPDCDAPINALRPLEARNPDAQIALTCLGVLCEGRPPEWLNLMSTDLRRADLDGLHLQGVIFDYSSLEAATISFVDLTRASFIHAILRHAEFSESILRHASFTNSDLRGARLFSADLEGADFSGADLREADLRESRAAAALFRGADLRWADLSDLDLSTADLSDSQLNGATANAGTRWSAGFDPVGAGVVIAEDAPTSRAILPGSTLRADLRELRSYP